MNKDENIYNIFIEEGDLIHMIKTNVKDIIIIHQCLCVKMEGAGLAKEIFKVFPETNVYPNRSLEENKIGNFGSAEIFNKNGTLVANCYGQFLPGPPSNYSKKWIPWLNLGKKLGILKKNFTDSEEERLDGLYLSIKDLILQLIEFYPNIKDIYIPINIGCGMGKGNSVSYEKLLLSIAIEYPNYNFYWIKYKPF